MIKSLKQRNVELLTAQNQLQRQHKVLRRRLRELPSICTMYIDFFTSTLHLESTCCNIHTGELRYTSRYFLERRQLLAMLLFCYNVNHNCCLAAGAT